MHYFSRDLQSKGKMYIYLKYKIIQIRHFYNCLIEDSKMNAYPISRRVLDSKKDFSISFCFFLKFIYLLRPKHENIKRKKLNWYFLPFALDFHPDHSRRKHIYIDTGNKQVHYIKAEGLPPCSLWKYAYVCYSVFQIFFFHILVG